MKTQTIQYSSAKTNVTLGGRIRLSLAATAVLLGCSAAYAGADNQPHDDKSADHAEAKHQTISFSGSGYIGYRSDSNVSVSELDTNSDAADGALQAEAQLKVSLMPTAKWENVLSVSQANTNYQTLSEFDLGLTTLSASTSYTFDVAKLGAHYYHASAKLDGRDFLTYQQYGLSAGKLLGQHIYLRLSSDIIDKQFENTPEGASIRDSEAVAVRSDLFYFFEGEDFFQIALKYQNEDAQDNVFDYIGKGVDLAYTYPIAMFNKPLKLKVGYQLDLRDYASEQDGGIGREDDRHVVEMSADYAIHNNVDIKLSTQYGDYASSVDGANYKETIAELGVNVHF
ncbi:hypothetical protein E5672_12975 [Alteromonas portus]|uniref:DUF560 domain-containing protein n=1 Tax=Alteromonas portus TaxID=2565549 RepID=A0A4U0Z9S4_9ALTE|nr:outer membrane beta-barrel protein [Alteromonas portus]TKB02771.1 hypothetical protein E5672_12975 [Alteromonas portus]